MSNSRRELKVKDSLKESKNKVNIQKRPVKPQEDENRH